MNDMAYDKNVFIKTIISVILHFLFISGLIDLVIKICKITAIIFLRNARPLFSIPPNFLASIFFPREEMPMYAFQTTSLSLDFLSVIIIFIILLVVYFNQKVIFEKYFIPYVLKIPVSFIILFIFIPVIFISNYALSVAEIAIISRISTEAIVARTFFYQISFILFNCLKFFILIIFTAVFLIRKNENA